MPMMNMHEGTRRLALVLGAVGAITGVVFGYGKARATWQARTTYTQWSKLENSHAVQIFLHQSLGPWVAYQMKHGATRGALARVAAGIAAARKAGHSDSEIFDSLSKTQTLGPRIAEAEKAGYSAGDILSYLEGTSPKPQGQYTAADIASGQPQQGASATTPVPAAATGDQGRLADGEYELPKNSEGIKSLVLANGVIQSFNVTPSGTRMDDLAAKYGGTLFVSRAYPDPFTGYLLALVFPVAGFLIPWSIVRVLYWVGSGFTS